jgi:hypothetical protein
MGDDYRVIANRSAVPMLKQKFYVTIVAVNGETLFTSERYRDKDHAVEMGRTWAKLCDGVFVNAT